MFAYNPKGLSSIPNMQVKNMEQFTPIISAPGEESPRRIQPVRQNGRAAGPVRYLISRTKSRWRAVEDNP